MFTTAQRCREILEQYYEQQHVHPLGPENPDLYARIKEVLRQFADAAKDRLQDPTPENIYIALANEIRGVSSHRQPLQTGAVETNSSEPSAMSLDEQALAVFFSHPDWTKKRIAKHIGANEKSLAPKRCPQLDKAIAGHKAMNKTTPRGSKDADGNLESWD